MPSQWYKNNIKIKLDRLLHWIYSWLDGISIYRFYLLQCLPAVRYRYPRFLTLYTRFKLIVHIYWWNISIYKIMEIFTIHIVCSLSSKLLCKKQFASNYFSLNCLSNAGTAILILCKNRNLWLIWYMFTFVLLTLKKLVWKIIRNNEISSHLFYI